MQVASYQEHFWDGAYRSWIVKGVWIVNIFLKFFVALLDSFGKFTRSYGFAMVESDAVRRREIDTRIEQ